MKYSTLKRMRYQAEEPWFPLSEDILGWDEDFHTLMLNDHIRMVTYANAIKAVVKPGHVVADIGTGTGILALWALEAGAKRVYGIDVNNKIIAIAQKRIAKAEFGGDWFIPVNDLSYHAHLPERVDVIISEILGNLGDNEDIARILNDARKRLLKQNGIMLPAHVETFLVPIESTKIHRQIERKTVKGISKKYSLAELMAKLNLASAFQLYYDAIVPRRRYLSQPKQVQQFSFYGRDATEYQKNLTFQMNRDGLLTGFKGYFIAQLSSRVILDISGDNTEVRQTSDCWKHCYLPIEHPIEVRRGDHLELTFSRYYPAEKNSVFRQCYAWSGKVTRRKEVVGRFEASMC